MRPAVLGAYATMLPRLEAERELRMIQAVAAGTGTMKPGPAKRMMDSLRRTAKAGRSGVRPKTVADLKAAGMRVTETVKGSKA